MVLKNNNKITLKKVTLESILIFVGGGLLLFNATHFLIPRFSLITGVEPILAWFLMGGLTVFFPLLIFSAAILHKENALKNWGTTTRYLRFRPLNYEDRKWVIVGLLLIGILTFLIQVGMEWILPNSNIHPPFLDIEPLSSGRYWILAVWLPFWILNIMGEEILWRGTILPRQEKSFGKYAWVTNAVGWTIFHIPFGWQMLILLSPILLLLPYLTQKTSNTWVAVILHGGLNGPGFLALAMGFA